MYSQKVNTSSYNDGDDENVDWKEIEEEIKESINDSGQQNEEQDDEMADESNIGSAKSRLKIGGLQL